MLISELPIGAKIREPLSGLVFQVCAQNHPDYPGTALILDTVLKQRCLDAREPGSSEDQKKYGNNTFYQSNLCMWLNSDAISDWYTPGHASDAPPLRRMFMTAEPPMRWTGAFWRPSQGHFAVRWSPVRCPV